VFFFNLPKNQDFEWILKTLGDDLRAKLYNNLSIKFFYDMILFLTHFYSSSHQLLSRPARAMILGRSFFLHSIIVYNSYTSAILHPRCRILLYTKVLY